MKQRHINDFPAKKQSDLQDIAKKIAITTLVSGASLSAFHYNANAEINKNLKDSSYIEKDASLLDPPLLNSTLQDLKEMPSYVDSSFAKKVKEKGDIYEEELKNKNMDADDVKLFSQSSDSLTPKSSINITQDDYLHYISANGDNVVVHYLDDNNQPLVFDEDDIDNQLSNSNSSNSHHSSGWFIYPFILNGNSYHSHPSGVVKSPSLSSKNSYQSKLSPSIKSSVKSGVGAGSSFSSKGASSSKGMGSSMSKGGGFGGGFGG